MTAQIACETWLPVPGYEGMYELRRDGAVLSLERMAERRDGRQHRVRERILRPCLVNGWPAVFLCREGRYRTVYVHVLLREVYGVEVSRTELADALAR